MIQNAIPSKFHHCIFAVITQIKWSSNEKGMKRWEKTSTILYFFEMRDAEMRDAFTDALQ